MMSSSNRIPSGKIIRAKEKAVYDGEMLIGEDYYAKTKIEMLLQESKEKIKKMEEKALAEIEEMKKTEKEKAFEIGYEDGKTKGKMEVEEEVRQEHQALLEESNEVYQKANDHLKEIIEKTEQLQNHYFEEKQEEVIDLVMLIVEEIVQDNVEKNPKLVASLLKKNIEKIPYHTKKIYVRIHPETEKMLEESGELYQDKRIEFLYDLQMKLGNFKLETDLEFIDVTIENQIEKMKQLLKG